MDTEKASKKYAAVIALLPRLLTANDTEDYVAGPTMLEHLKSEYGLTPLQKGSRLTVFDRHDVDNAIERMKISMQ